MVYYLHPCVDDNSTAPLVPGLLPSQTSSVFVCDENVKADVLSIPCETGSLLRRFDLCAGRKFGVLGDHNDPVPHKVKVTIDVLIPWERLDYDIITDPYILIQNRAFDMTAPANANGKIASRFFYIIVVRAHQEGRVDPHAFRNSTAQPDNRIRNGRARDDATITQN